MTSKRSNFIIRMAEARDNFEAQDELKNLIHGLVEKEIPFTIGTRFKGKMIQIWIDPEYNPYCIDFLVGYGIHGLEMGWLPEGCESNYTYGYLTADEALRFVTQEVPMPDSSD